MNAWGPRSPAKVCVRAARKLASEARRWAWRSAVVHLLEATAGSPPAGVEPPTGVGFGEAGPADVGPLFALGLGPRVAQRRFNAGDRCFVARLLPNHNAFMCWVHWGPCYVADFGHILEAEGADAYLYHVTTRADLRGRGIGRAALSWVGGELSREGCARFSECWLTPMIAR